MIRYIPLYSLILAFSLPTLGWAIPLAISIYGSAVQAGGPEGVCKIIVRGPSPISSDYQVEGLCTGTLVDRNQVITAAHCLKLMQAEGATIEAKCGYRPATMDFKESHSVKSYAIDPGYAKHSFKRDIAVITLSRESKIKPIKRLTQEEYSAYFVSIKGRESPQLVKGVVCHTAGFGSSEKNKTGGQLFQAPLPADKLESFNQHTLSDNPKGGYYLNMDLVKKFDETDKKQKESLERVRQLMSSKDLLKRAVNGDANIEGFRFFQTQRWFGGFAAVGDSGGPVYCRSKSTEDWRLIGVATSAGYFMGDPNTLVLENTWSILLPEHRSLQENGTANTNKKSSDLIPEASISDSSKKTLNNKSDSVPDPGVKINESPDATSGRSAY